MAQATFTRTALFDAVKDRIDDATGASYDERMSVGQIPNGRASYFCIGGRITSFRGKEREQAGDVVAVSVVFPIEYAHRVMPKQRETRRGAVDTIVDSLQQTVTLNKSGLETRWLGETESESPSGEWIIIKARVEARCLLSVGA
jgi:hypothetical protein